MGSLIVRHTDFDSLLWCTFVILFAQHAWPPTAEFTSIFSDEKFGNLYFDYEVNRYEGIFSSKCLL